MKEERNIRVYNSRSYDAPCIILQGKWLAELGFSAGDYLSVKCQKDQITIQIKERFQKK